MGKRGSDYSKFKYRKDNYESINNATQQQSRYFVG